MPALSRAGTAMAVDPTREYFAGADRDRAAFEVGIKLGSIVHQYVGAPLTSETAAPLERAIEAATRGQPLVEPALQGRCGFRRQRRSDVLMDNRDRKSTRLKRSHLRTSNSRL